MDRLRLPSASPARPTAPRASASWLPCWGRNRLPAAYIVLLEGSFDSIRIATGPQVYGRTQQPAAHGIFTHCPCQRIDESRICRTLATFRSPFGGFKSGGILNRKG